MKTKICPVCTRNQPLFIFEEKESICKICNAICLERVEKNLTQTKKELSNMDFGLNKIIKWWNNRPLRCNNCGNLEPRIYFTKRETKSGKFEIICNRCISLHKELRERQIAIDYAVASAKRRQAEKERTQCFRCGVSPTAKSRNFYCPNCYDDLISEMYKAERTYNQLKYKVKVIKDLERIK